MRHALVAAQTPHVTVVGLTGELVLREGVVPGRRRRTADVTLEGKAFLNPLRLATDAAHEAADGATFRALVDSVRALPTRFGDLAAVGHWSE